MKRFLIADRFKKLMETSIHTLLVTCRLLRAFSLFQKMCAIWYLAKYLLEMLYGGTFARWLM
jgi:hypothetical protein